MERTSAFPAEARRRLPFERTRPVRPGSRAALHRAYHHWMASFVTARVLEKTPTMMGLSRIKAAIIAV